MVHKDPEELPCINDLTAPSLRSSSLGRTPTPFVSGWASLPCFHLNKLFLCVLSHLLCYVSNNKLCTCFYSFASVRNVFFTGGKSQGVWWLGVLVFIQATQVQFLGRELRSPFTPPLTAASLRSLPLSAPLEAILGLGQGSREARSLINAKGTKLRLPCLPRASHEV